MFALQSFVLAGFYVAAVLATTIPAFPPLKVDKVIDAAAYMGNLTAVESNVEKRTLGNSFLCTGAGFTGNCVLITGEQNGGCVNLGPDLDKQVSSFGPDQGQNCFLWRFPACGSFNSAKDLVQNVRFPGIANLADVNFDNAMSSYQ
ncbi:hypothetical protein C8J57DRAFT_1673250 [Mycena rebaudengoi]|nr:hypothetical protein C8J57DRAFT_1259128 [Mycena rebaudengoi]KAJ7247953.1 hypothetical protein C8J57DRAFT_1673250 [Mycena rebaudengoi]